MSSHLRSVREAMMKWTNLWDGSEPASLFMSKWLVFVDLPRTWPHQIDQLREPGKEGADYLPYIKKTSSFVLIWPESQPRALYLHSWSCSVELCWPLRLSITAWLVHSSTVGKQTKCMHEFHITCNWDTEFVLVFIPSSSYVILSRPYASHARYLLVSGGAAQGFNVAAI